MSRFLIIDTSKLEAGNPLKSMNGPSEAVLSKKETETVFKDIWDNGFRCGDSDDWSDKTRKAIDEKWEELKKTL